MARKLLALEYNVDYMQMITSYIWNSSHTHDYKPTLLWWWMDISVLEFQNSEKGWPRKIGFVSQSRIFQNNGGMRLFCCCYHYTIMTTRMSIMVSKLTLLHFVPKDRIKDPEAHTGNLYYLNKWIPVDFFLPTLSQPCNQNPNPLRNEGGDTIVVKCLKT